jgi:drug/metabolite transporter (DMT)-like permease
LVAPRPRLLARLALLGATVIWGATFVVVQRALATIPVFHLLVYRFALGALLLLPLLRGPRRPGLWRAGLGLGLAVFAGFALQTAGLLYTTPSRSAFVTGLTVVLVPFLAAATGAHRLRAAPVAGSLLAALGLWVLYRPAAGAKPFGLGDLLTLGCAAAFAVYVVAIEGVVRRHPVAHLAVVQFLVITLLASPSLLLQPPRAAELTGAPLAAVLVLGVFATAVAFLGQLYAQQHLSAVETALILTAEPLFAAALSVALGVEAWTPQLAWGGALVVAAMLLSEVKGSPPEAAGP